LQSPRDWLAGCSSWPLRFADYSSGANLNRRSSCLRSAGTCAFHCPTLTWKNSLLSADFGRPRYSLEMGAALRPGNGTTFAQAPPRYAQQPRLQSDQKVFVPFRIRCVSRFRRRSFSLATSCSKCFEKSYRYRSSRTGYCDRNRPGTRGICSQRPEGRGRENRRPVQPG
jgi:hypothetical protein